MGGIGSGRHGTTSCTDEHRFIDVRQLSREGLLHPGLRFNWTWTLDGKKVAYIAIRTGSGHLTLAYHFRRWGEKEWIDMEYAVKLASTGCHYGGRRTWFLCPISRCGKRVAMLYAGDHGLFSCRSCAQLAYRCQRETAGSRLIRRAERIRERMKWQPGIWNRTGDKPARMHWKTYYPLWFKHTQLVQASVVNAMAQFAETS